MVYQDLSDTNSPQPKHFKIAPVADRFLAFIFDLVIFTPIFSLILAGVFKHLELMYFISPNSIEFLILVSVAFLFALILAILFQTLFLVWLGATPGKYFFKTKVVSVSSPSERLRFSQAFLRSTLWAFEFLFFALPWLEVISEQKRRPLHDRAAGTMVITRKNQGDNGPHILETQFVRQLLVAFSLLLLTWSIFTVGHFYKLALKGDFKKSELEADEYLCSSVTQSLDSGDSRIDKAIALYLADEISEDCLASEADFVLWTPSDLEKSWAYLAKGILKKYDTEQFESYLQKACDMEEEGSACELSQFQADPLHHKIPAGTETGRILQVVQDFEKGRYAQAEKIFLELGKVSGFETFSRQGVVKSLWAQNKIEKSKGAYLNVVHQLVPSQKRELAAWVCLEEMDRSCSQAAIEACEDLKNEFQESAEPIRDSFVALALIREKECRHTSAVEYLQFQDLFQDKKDLFAFVQTLTTSGNTSLDPEKRSQILKSLAFRKEPVRPQFIRLQAIQKWVDLASSNEDFQILATFLKDKKVQDLSWVKIYKKTLDRFLKAQSEKYVKEIIDLPSPEMIAIYDLQSDQMKGQYLVKDFEKAYQQLKALQIPDSRRAPASNRSDGDIEADLQKRFESRGSR